MKKYLVVGITLILPIFILAISLTDYKEAETYFKEAYINGSMSAAAGNQDQASYNGSALINYKTNYNSLPFAWSLQTTGSSNFGRGATDGDESKIGYDMTAHSNADKYFTDKVFGYGSMDFGYRKAIDADNADDVFAKTGFGAGYGRVFDATVLAKAMRVVDDLASYGLINGKVSDSAYLELSKIIDKEIE
ncbi:MAG: hypothetical protein U9N34_10515, partial [Candidatus Cloacimonadota bacterium]|nr:hypothetical protein [Candidatus Cloacimonadota bacterium]